MPLYELFVISRPTAVKETNLLHEIIKRTATRLLDGKAIVRKLDYMGTRKLPYRMKLYENYVYDGSYWQIQFFSKTLLLDTLRYHLKYDPDVVRFTILKKADTLKGYIQP